MIGNGTNPLLINTTCTEFNSKLIINNDSGVVRLPSSNNNQEKNHKSSFLNSYGMRKPNAQQQQNLSPRDHGRTDTKQDRIFKFQTENYVQNIVSFF